MNRQIKLTNCCGSYSTYYEDILCCKTCYKEVSEGEGDGTKYDECYDCLDEYETKLVKVKDKNFCEDCLEWRTMAKITIKNTKLFSLN